MALGYKQSEVVYLVFPYGMFLSTLEKRGVVHVQYWVSTA